MPVSAPASSERRGDVVACADEGDPQPLEAAEPLAEREQVGERLARVVASVSALITGTVAAAASALDRRLRERA